MFHIMLVILLLFLVARVALFGVQRYHDAHASGSAFSRMQGQGKIEDDVFEDARWDEVRRFGKTKLRPTISGEKRRAIRAAKNRERAEFLARVRPGFYQYVIIFLIASVLGLLLEMTWMFLLFGILESRVGLVWGPFSPLYGFGAVLLTMVLWRLRDRPVPVIFLISALIGGVLEQATGWGMEVFMNAESWSYLHLPDHITQWVAWRFLAMWGVIGVLWCKAIMPELIYRIGEPTSSRQRVLVAALAIFIAVDFALTLACFYRAGKRVEGVAPQNAFEEYVDRHYDDDFMSSTFENLSFGSS